MSNRASLRSESYVKELLMEADVTVGGDRPQDIEVFDDAFYDYRGLR